MGVCLGDLDRRHIERLRIELAETIAAHFAYPPFFDFAARQAVTRPIDRAKRDEVDIFLQSVNFGPVERTDLTSPEIRRFIEHLFQRYIEVNGMLSRPQVARRAPEMRSRALRVAAEMQRGLLGYLDGTVPNFGVRPPRRSWVGKSATTGRDPREAAHRTQMLEAALLRYSTGALPLPAPAHQPPASPERQEQHEHHKASGPLPRAAKPVSAAETAGAAGTTAAASAGMPHPLDMLKSDWGKGNGYAHADSLAPLPPQGLPPAPSGSPFAGLEVGAQSAVFTTVTAMTESLSGMLTGPLSAPQGEAAAISATTAQTEVERGAATEPRELPPDLYQLYGEYLRDMHPEFEDAAPALAPVAELEQSTMDLPAMPSRAARNDFLNAPNAPAYEPYTAYESYGGAPDAELEPPAFLTDRAEHPSSRADQGQRLGQRQNKRQSEGMDGRGDKLIFWQLRYQLEAYIRRAARSYGVPAMGGDPSSVLDVLRRSGFVDGSDLRIAEGVLALTDRVTATGVATIDDYRQAMLLYLLYHRSHLG